VTALAASVIAGGKAALRRPFAYRRNRRLAVQLARQIGGTYARASSLVTGTGSSGRTRLPSRSTRPCLRA
jgi:hypothetical protein